MRLLRPLFLLLLPSTALADPFDDFRIPEHRVFSWTANLSTGAAYEQAGLFYGGDRKDGTAQASMGTDASWLYDSDPRRTFFAVGLSAAGDRHGTDQDDMFETARLRGSALMERWAIFLSDRRYPWDVPLGLDLGLQAEGRYGQSWSNDRTWNDYYWLNIAEENRASTHREQYNHWVGARAMLGAGRVRDATAVYDIWVLEDRLRSRGVLRGPLSVATREKLSALLYNSFSYELVLDRPGRRYWEDFIEILQRDENFAGTWDPVSAMRVLEPFFGPELSFSRFVSRSPIARQRGWFAGVASEASYQDQRVNSTASRFLQQTVSDTLQPPLISDSASTSSDRGRALRVGPRVEWHRPLGPHWQVDAQTEQMFQMQDIGTFDFPTAMFSYTRASVDWLVTDRWLASIDAFHNLILFRQDDIWINGIWGVGVGGTLSWFLEDHLQLALSADGSQHRDFAGLGRQYHASLSLSYRFAGRIENPGLTNPIRVP
jgi:hypothetical protein